MGRLKGSKNKPKSNAGRPRKDPQPDDVRESGAKSFKCSVCDFVANKFTATDKHVLTSHYGMARINDPENTPFSENDRITAFIRAQKLLKALKCEKCEKSFKSGLGFKFHIDMCGKTEEELLRACEICGKMLKVNSVTAHIRQMHTDNNSNRSDSSNKPTTDKDPTKVQVVDEAIKVSGKGRKRSSAIKAMSLFKELSDDEEEKDGRKVANGNSDQVLANVSGRKRLKRSKDDDEFKLSANEIEAIEKEDAEKDSDQDSSITEEEEDEDGELEEEEEEETEEDEQADENDDGNKLSGEEFDELFLLATPHLKRVAIKDVPSKLWSSSIEDSVQQSSVIENGKKCYNEKCQKMFDNCVERENHYRKCCDMQFNFACALETESGERNEAREKTQDANCSFVAKWIDLETIRHFYSEHHTVIAAQSERWLELEQRFISKHKKTKRKSKSKRAAYNRSDGSKKASSEASSTQCDYSREISAAASFDYTKEMIRFMIDNSRPLTYKCFASLRSHWQAFKNDARWLQARASIVPRFKTTTTMEAGDDEYKFIAPLHALQNVAGGCRFIAGKRATKAIGSTKAQKSLSATFNVGQYVSCAAWAPHPVTCLAEMDAKSNHDRLPTFAELRLEARKQARTHYLAIATGSLERDLNFNLDCAPQDCHAFLQIWDMGSLQSSSSSSAIDHHQPADVSKRPEVKIALNICHTYGDILEIAWCPCGSSYEDVSNDSSQAKKNPSADRLARLGILAVACEDGRVRLLAIPHPANLPQSYDSTIIFEARPLLVLASRFLSQFNSCTSLSWSRFWPQNLILGGFTNGNICLWDLKAWANCEGSCAGDAHLRAANKVLRPLKTFENPRNCQIIAVRWMNERMFFSSTSESCRIWHVDYHPRPYGEYSRNIVSALEVHPLWHSTIIMMDLMLNRANVMVTVKSFAGKERLSRYTTAATSEAIKVHTIANLGRIRLNDISLSPWMYVVAYCTENGQLYSSPLLPKPYRFPKQFSSYLLYKIQLADLIHLDANVDDSEEVEVSPKSRAGRPSKKAAKTSVAELLSKPASSNRKKDVLLKGCLDLAHTSKSDFCLKYFLLFDDSKVQFNASRFIASQAGASDGSSSCGDLLTKNDLLRLYSITNCAWNPNLSAYSWLFSGSKAGLCRIDDYPLVNPQSNAHTKTSS